MTCARLPGIKKEKNSASSGSVSAHPVSATPINSDHTKPNTVSLNTAVISTVTGFSSEVTSNSDKSSSYQLPLTDEHKPAMMLFQHLAQAASQYGHSFEDTVKAWWQFIDGISPEQKVEGSKLTPATPDTGDW